ncbi:MAG: hypothetical protein JXR97_08435 [Planctomycetes bacterium]|nr:hypothetical protein [Planctomycetota bacterium]
MRYRAVLFVLSLSVFVLFASCKQERQIAQVEYIDVVIHSIDEPRSRIIEMSDKRMSTQEAKKCIFNALAQGGIIAISVFDLEKRDDEEVGEFIDSVKNIAITQGAEFLYCPAVSYPQHPLLLKFEEARKRLGLPLEPMGIRHKPPAKDMYSIPD